MHVAPPIPENVDALQFEKKNQLHFLVWGQRIKIKRSQECCIIFCLYWLIGIYKFEAEKR